MRLVMQYPSLDGPGRSRKRSSRETRYVSVTACGNSVTADEPQQEHDGPERHRSQRHRPSPTDPRPQTARDVGPDAGRRHRELLGGEDVVRIFARLSGVRGHAVIIANPAKPRRTPAKCGQ